MTCKEYQYQIVLFLYEELQEHERPLLEAHIIECTDCKATFEEHQGMHGVLSEDAMAWEVPADLLSDSRRVLADELDRMERKRPWWRLPAFSVVLTPMRMLESGALVALGLALGVYISNQHVSTSPAPSSASTAQSDSISAIPQNGTVSNLRIVTANAATGDVELAGEVVQPLRLQGKMDNDTVRGLLVSALRNSASPGSRLRAVEVLSENSSDGSVKDALIQAMVSDDNPGVRGKALEGLKAFVAQEDVRTAFMHALANDQDAGIRVQAIEALTHFAQNDTVVQTIQQVTKDDDNAYVRMKGLQFVGNPR